MKLLPIRKILRLFLAISVSAWMAGAGCLLGCSKETRASSPQANSTETIVAAESCASSHSHDCCAKKRHTQTAKAVTSDVNGQFQLTALPPRAMESCPMAVNSSAIVSKADTNNSHDVLTRRVELPSASGAAATIHRSVNTSNLFNRGPTYIRCCVFLI
jgi:hypothetical protein